MPSQYGQDQWVVQFLGGKREGYFLDMGASNGIDSSNTQLLEQRFGWRGLCIEPNSQFYEKLIQNRQCLCLNACVYDREADLPFLESAGTLGGLLEGFGQEQLQHAIRKKKLKLDAEGHPSSVLKRTLTLDSVLRLAKAPQTIDYWSLDTEGTEFSILQSFPFDRYFCNVLTVEHNLQPVRSLIRDFLEARGYEYWTSFIIDDCFVRKAAFPARYRSSAVWRNFR